MAANLPLAKEKGTLAYHFPESVHRERSASIGISPVDNAVKQFGSRIRQNSGIAGDTTEVWRLRLPSQRREYVSSNSSRRCLLGRTAWIAVASPTQRPGFPTRAARFWFPAAFPR